MGFLGSLGKLAGGVVGGFLTGGPLGAVAGGAAAVSSVIKSGSSSGGTPYPTGTSIIKAAPTVLAASGGGGGFLSSGLQGPNLPKSFPGSVPEPGVLGTIQRFLPGGQSGYTGAPPGYHVNKAYVRHLRAQAMGRKSTDPFKAPRAVNTVVKNRHMNPLNPRALRAALRRQGAAVSLMRRALKGSGYTVKRSGLGKAGRGRKRR